MPHATCVGSPIASMKPELEKQMRVEVVAAMAAVEGAGFEERQVCLAIPAETRTSRSGSSYKPVLHVRFAFDRDRTDNKLRDICSAAAEVLYSYFQIYGVTEVQFTWEVDEASRFNRFPSKS